jgi:uroporphyrinogen-III synthase
VIVTRPLDDATRWVQALQSRGVQALALPLITIEPVPDVQPLQRLWQERGQYSAMMFVSANAVRHFMAAQQQGSASAWSLPLTLRAWATGPGTQAALLAQGWPAAQIDMPDAQAQVWDSEALWARVQTAVQPGQTVLIVRGADEAGQMAGRDWLARALTQAGARVQQCVAYVRRCPSWGEAERALALQHTRPHTGPSAWWLFSSTEAATHLLRLCPDLPVQQGRALATHPRIAQGLRAQGWGRVELVAPGLDRLVESIESLA